MFLFKALRGEELIDPITPLGVLQITPPGRGLVNDKTKDKLKIRNSRGVKLRQ